MINHGNPNPIKIANLFDAIAPQMLMSAFEFFFIMIALVIMSGMAEPKDKIVIPATTSDNPMILPENKHKNNFIFQNQVNFLLINSTFNIVMYDKPVIQIIDIINVKTNVLSLGFGKVHLYSINIGIVMKL